MTDYDLSAALRAAAQADQDSRVNAESVVRSALINTIVVGAYNFQGRHSISAADMRVFDAVWRLLVRHFTETPPETKRHERQR